MKTWFRRVISLMLIALGIALIAFKYNNQQSGYTEKEVVYLQLENYLDPGKVKTDYPASEPVELTGPEMNQDDFPCIWWAVADLDESWPTDTCEIEEWEKLKTAFSEKAKINELVVFHDRLIRAEEQHSKIVFNYLGEYNPHIKELTEDDFKKYPEILTAINELNPGGNNSKSIPLKQWDVFVNRNLDPFNDGQRFRYNGKVYGPEFGSDVTVLEREFKSLSIVFKIVGFVLFLAGLFLLFTIYKRKRGIMVNPRKVAVIYDVITLLFAVPSAWILIYVLLKKFLFIEPFYEEQEMNFMGIFFFVFSIPFVSLFTSRFTSQSVVINAKGILVDSLRSAEFVAWDAIESIDFSDEYIPVGRVGTVIPRKLQQSLSITGTDGNSVIINEPQLKSVKKKIISKMEQEAPDAVFESIAQILHKR